MSRLEDTDKREQAQPLAEALASAFDEEFAEFAASTFVRKALRESIAGNVKRRSLLHLGFAQGCKVGNYAADLMQRASLATSLGVAGDLAESLPEWAELMARVRRLAEGDPS